MPKNGWKSNLDISMEQKGVLHRIPLSIDILAALCILLISVVSRWNEVSAPIADTHTWKQMESYSIIRNYASGTPSFLHPMRDVMYLHGKPAQSAAYRLPLYEYTASAVIRFFGDHISVLRLYSVFLASVIVWCTYYFGSRYINKTVGVVAAFVLHGFPGFVYWGSAIIPEVFATAVACVGLLGVMTKHAKWRYIGAFLIGIAIATKVIYVVFLIPSLYWVVSQRSRYSSHIIIGLVFFMLIPFLLWQIRTGYIPLSERAWPSYSYYAFHSRNVFQNLSETQWFEVLLKERILGRLFTPLGGILLLLSSTLLFQKERVKTVIFLWFFSAMAMFVIVAWGTLQHEYNHILVYPVAALIIGMGLLHAFTVFKKNAFSLSWVAVVCSVPFVLWYMGIIPFQQALAAYYWQEVKYTTFASDIAQVQRSVPSDAVVVLLDLYDPQGGETLFYAFGRPGWIITEPSTCTSEGIATDIQQYTRSESLYLVLNKEPYYAYDEVYTPSCDTRDLMNDYASGKHVIFEGNHLALIAL
jgi:hypothetical protein